MIKTLKVLVVIWFWLAAFAVGVAALVWLPLVPSVLIGFLAATGWGLIYLTLFKNE